MHGETSSPQISILDTVRSVTANNVQVCLCADSPTSQEELANAPTIMGYVVKALLEELTNAPTIMGYVVNDLLVSPGDTKSV